MGNIKTGLYFNVRPRHRNRHTALIKSFCILTKSFCQRQNVVWTFNVSLNILNHPLNTNLQLYAALRPIKCFRQKLFLVFFSPAKRRYRRKKDVKPSAEGHGENTSLSAGKSKSNGP